LTTVVHKYGGTSVAQAQGRLAAAQQVAAARREGYAVVVVVSAMGRLGDPYATDTLLRLPQEEAPVPVPARDEDLLASCGEVISAVVFAQTLRGLGLEAVPLTGAQAGIYTDGTFGDAKIVRIDPDPTRSVLERGKVPVVTGFQGVTEDGEVTTLGRGGSDTTAAALGVALGAQEVKIYTDVQGIMTADPRIVPEARILPRIDYEETFELATLGARVVHPRAVEIARRGRVPLRVLSTFDPDGGGTWIGPREAKGMAMEDRWSRRDPAQTVVGVTVRTGLTYVETPAGGSTCLRPQVLFEALGAEGISLDLIHVAQERTSFVLRQGDMEHARRVLDAVLGPGTYRTRAGLAKVGVVGSAIHDMPGVMAVFMGALARVGAQVVDTSDSHQSISALVREEEATAAARALHEAFGLGGA
jgi:aspartate kinase